MLILSDRGPAFLPGQQGISGPLIESQTQSVFARFMAVHTGGAPARAVDVIPGLAILDILQVAITKRILSVVQADLLFHGHYAHDG